MTPTEQKAPAKQELSIWDILMHLHDVQQTIIDAEHLVMDLIKKQPAAEDAKALLKDIEQDLIDGIIPLPPGVTADQIIKVIQGWLPTS